MADELYIIREGEKVAMTAEEISAWRDEQESVLPLPAISRRQFFQALAKASPPIISEDEAIAALQSGQIPAAVQEVLDTLPAEQLFDAKMLIVGATTFDRHNPLVQAFGDARGMSSSEVDEFWTSALAL